MEIVCNICDENMVKLIGGKYICPECGNQAYINASDEIVYEYEDYNYDYVYNCVDD